MLKKALLAGIAGAIISLLFSGCFVMRTLTYTDDKVEPGEKSTAKVTINGETGQMMKTVATFDDSVRAKRGDDNEFPFFYLEAQDENTKLTNGGKFDTGGVFAGPKALKVNATPAQDHRGEGPDQARSERDRRGRLRAQHGHLARRRRREPRGPGVERRRV
jgi:hypothetical protein